MKVDSVHYGVSLNSPNINPGGYVFITGATSGLGKKVALTLAKAGRSLVISGRRQKALDDLEKEIKEVSSVEIVQFLADLSDLRQISTKFKEIELPKIHGFFANAGLTTMKMEESKQGFDMTFAVNVLSHQLLLQLLTPLLLESGRVIIVSSGVHLPENKLARFCGVSAPRWVGVEALASQKKASGEKRLQNGTQRYSTSKLANVLQAAAFQNHLNQQNRRVDVFALDPGLMVDTDLSREFPEFARGIFKFIGTSLTPFVDNMRLSDTTAEHVLGIFESREWHGKGFAYLDGNRIRLPSSDAQRVDYQAELWNGVNQILECLNCDLK